MKNLQKTENSLKTSNFDGKFRRARLLAVLSASIATGQYELILLVLKHLKHAQIGRRSVYETIIQSYLFLGFPRMIEAAFAFHEIYGRPPAAPLSFRADGNGADKWKRDGLSLCRKIYGKNYDLLEKRIRSVGPEIFEWMVMEGYGKVLSRPGLTKIERELAEVAALIIEKRGRQLISHLIGSLNVGADIELLRRINRDIAVFSGSVKFKWADSFISKIEGRREAQN
ncbi:hypothetical protein TRIP_C21481 [Candidatus Zixiibacteriota bacterium]|nr:hypothetical protein TRIP_C21481 [candidate division Zixibacteria bacterium]